MTDLQKPTYPGQWGNTFFAKTSDSSKSISGYKDRFQSIDESAASDFMANANWELFNPAGESLGTREIRSNTNLLDPEEFARYWQTGKHKNYKIYSGYDTDGDGITDMIALDPKNVVVGFNERYIIDEGKGEYPYKRDYYKLPKDERKKMSYSQFLENQETKEGWKDLTKYKESRSKATWKRIYNHVGQVFKALGATPKETEKCSKDMLSIISKAIFFDPKTPAHQIRIVMSSPEFKKIQSQNVTTQLIQQIINQQNVQALCKGFLNAARGYNDGGAKNYLSGYLAGWHNVRIDAAAINDIYLNLLSKSAATKAYKEKDLTPMAIARDPNKAQEFSQAVQKIMQELDKKNQIDQMKVDITYSGN